MKLPKLNFTVNAGYGFPNLTGSSTVTSLGTGSNGGNISPIYVEAGYNYSHKGLISLYFSSAKATTGNFKWSDSVGNYNYYYNASIVTVGLSTKYYLGNATNFLPYVGGMVGYYFINLISNGEFPLTGSVTISQGGFAYQVYGGVVYYFNKWLGLDARAGYGNTYYAAVGLSFRFKISQKQ